MKRFTLSLMLVGLLVAACSAAASPAPTSTAIPSPSPSPAAATAASSTGAPSPSPELVTTAAASFDGKACTYAGPPDLPRGSAVTFSLVNTTAAHTGNSMGGGLVIAAVVDGTAPEEIIKFFETNPATKVADAPFAGYNPLDNEVYVIWPPEADQGKTVTATMKANLYAVLVATSPTETNKGFFCTLLKVHDR